MVEDNMDLKKELSKKFYEMFIKVILSEKATMMQEFSNKITFVVSKSCDKPLIKMLIEEELGEKVKKVNVLNHIKGGKRAIVSFQRERAAADIISRFELI